MAEPPPVPSRSTYTKSIDKMIIAYEAIVNEYEVLAAQVKKYLQTYKLALSETTSKLLSESQVDQVQKEADTLYWKHELMAGVITNTFKSVTKKHYTPTPTSKQYTCRKCKTLNSRIFTSWAHYNQSRGQVCDLCLEKMREISQESE